MSIAQCMERLEMVFQRLRSANLKLKGKKCLLFQRKFIPGHIVENGVSCDPAKIEAVQRWERPVNQKQLRSFLGPLVTTNDSIKDFAELCEPLYKLTSVRTPQKLQWTEKHQQAFEKLKEKLMSAPIMSYPTETGKYILDTDASGVAIGAVLHQEQVNQYTGETELKVIAYASRVLRERETRYCARRRELLAIVDFVKHF